MEKFIIEANDCLLTRTLGFYHTDYFGYGMANNPNYINDLKNIFGYESNLKLKTAMNTVRSILQEELSLLHQIFQNNNLENNLVACMIPRSKTNARFGKNQLLLKEAVRQAVQETGFFVDGLDYIRRQKNTCTTHMAKSNSAKYNNDGDMPYKGITLDTCYFSPQIQGKNILLIDDVYTCTVDIVEDAIEALYDKGAKNVVFYALAKTVFRGYK